ncbi:MAG: hypothetical protein KAV87_56040 [Desulfobacteraceae bacterium]|nr:hypothetical protein [Desulfobacteraceae bacterium]
MKEIDQNSLDTAIALGDAVCEELGICCEKRGQVIFQVYKKLEEMKPKKDTTVTEQSPEAQAE